MNSKINEAALSKTNEIYQCLKNDILNLRFKSDELFNEKSIADKYSVSKTPVREALAMLVQEGYLKKIPRVGYFIKELAEEEYVKLLYLRYVLEKGVVEYIIRNCSSEDIDSLKQYCEDKNVPYEKFSEINLKFHFALANLTHNEYLINSIQNTFARLIRVPSPNLYAERRIDPHIHHLRLIELIKERNIEKALVQIRNECRRDDDKEMPF